MSDIVIRGITWDHPRGHAPLVATAGTFRDAFPEVEVRWQARSLEDFAHYPVDRLADEYDLVVFDHPSCGIIAESGCFSPLETVVHDSILERCAAAAVGGSHQSYRWDGSQLGLGIDAACHVAAFRPDLIARSDIPRTWEAVLDLADAGLEVGVPFFPTDCFCMFTSLAAHLGADPFAPECRLEQDLVATVLDVIQRLALRAEPLSLDANPIAILDAMACGNDIAYCPLLFGYSNYARPGFAEAIIEFAPPPTFGAPPHRMILGGAGIGVSAQARNLEEIAAYLDHLTAAETQRGVYVESGGQPVDRSAWTDHQVNATCSGFFAATLDVIETAYVRPRHVRMIEVQQRVGRAIHEHIIGTASSADTVDLILSM